MRRSYLLGALLFCACAPERIVETASAPQATAAQRSLSDSDYVAACEHRGGVRLRLYGCKLKGPQRIPLFIVDGRPLPTDTIGPGKLARESFIAQLEGNKIELVEVIKPDSSTRNLYGVAARFGVIKITLLPAYRAIPPQ